MTVGTARWAVTARKAGGNERGTTSGHVVPAKNGSSRETGVI